ncbi:TetR/AcrR family transcriptional regulator [Streptomyces sp. SP17BM10]|uniref:TetR/AcrR family transcriptional regulator n=1 Tax=Streptomyces sp. SP17BM10 TaxID=3002530 RepID=UPI002E7AA4AA|nr:TetR/AcrR family transcriptional regulator [Streptomyces sp. SP17BM10]MEE1781567.1 TetR/AcrR family transcriptional regulator [Streptomyces sp. SP17BM10]
MGRAAVGGAQAGRASRRRGDELERAILDAVWAELAEHGYDRLTMDGVAVRARTSKPVLYRRWPSRPALVIAALGRNAPDYQEPPDTGELRSDLAVFLLGLLHRFDDLPMDAVHGFLVDLLRDPELRVRFRTGLTASGPVGALETMMRRAADRGQINAARITPRTASLPLDLLRDAFLVGGVVPSGQVVDEILDEVVLPLLKAP